MRHSRGIAIGHSKRLQTLFALWLRGEAKAAWIPAFIKQTIYAQELTQKEEV